MKATNQKSQYEETARQVGAPTSVSEQMQQAYLKLLDQKPQEAEAIYRDVLKSDPANVAALSGLMRLLLQQKKEAEARSVYEAARAAAPKNDDIRRMELAFSANLPPEEQDKKLLEMIQAEPDEQTRNLQLYGFYVIRSKFSEAQKIADQMEKATPDNEQVVAMQFGLAMNNKDWARAQKYVDTAAQES